MTHKTDEQLKHLVTAELRWDQRVDETEIGVAVVNGVVTLTGTVNSFAKKLAAQEAVHRVAGVLDVANDIKVKTLGSTVRDDAAIARAARHALEWDVWVRDQEIQTTVSDGWITLDGSVESLTEREDAERAVNKLVGVRGVTNRLVVAPKVTASNVQHLIQAALERRADHEPPPDARGFTTARHRRSQFALRDAKPRRSALSLLASLRSECGGRKHCASHERGVCLTSTRILMLAGAAYF
jgi:osmotically-inducible protein OsmY